MWRSCCWNVFQQLFIGLYSSFSERRKQELRPQRQFFHLQWSMVDINKMMILGSYLIDLTVMNCSWIFSLYGVLKPLALRTLGRHHIAKGLSLSQRIADGGNCKGPFSSLLCFSRKSRSKLGCQPIKTFQTATKSKMGFQSLQNRIYKSFHYSFFKFVNSSCIHFMDIVFKGKQNSQIRKKIPLWVTNKVSVNKQVN